MQRIGFLILMIVTYGFCDKITDLTGKKYVLTEVDTVYTYESSSFLYHVSNLSIILEPYERIVRTKYEPSQNEEENILIDKIETLKSQLIPSEYRAKRALNFLGSALKFVTGTPDHDDLVEIKTGLNQLIENNNQQRKINSRFEKILATLNPESIFNQSVLTEIYNELITITNTINFAKTGNFFSGTLNFEDVQQVIKGEIYNMIFQ